MTPGVLALVLGAAVAHALWNLAAKTVAGRGYAFVLAYHGLSALLLAPVAIWLIASGRQSIDGSLLAAALLSALLHIGYSVSLQAGYDHAPLGVVYPSARGIGPVLTIIVAVTVLGERLSAVEIIGALTVLAGIAVVTVRPRGGVDPSGGAQPSGGVARGLAWGALIGTFIAGYTLWDDFAVNHVTTSPLLYFAVSEAVVAGLMGAGLVTLPGGRARRADLRAVVGEHRWALVTVAVLSPLAYLLVLYAMQSAPVALVAPVRETSIIIGTLLAWWLFGERNIAAKLTGAVIVVGGIGLIALG
ncbi:MULTISPECIES: DMT family transporter [unclassified Brevibacterium]|uniref:DMT family transporter n=1 Tax=unclassified Brevibacterium TaxID=2614124 RepID=UPI0010F9FAD9|nr:MULTISPECIES: DMT family transporter [unclassified Brevibacterium]MCM1013880.1 DMT family transporter [Brevibacterium sp. XM4083]